MNYKRFLLATSSVCAPLAYYSFLCNAPSEAVSLTRCKLETSVFPAVGNLRSSSAIRRFSDNLPVSSEEELGGDKAIMEFPFKLVPMIFEGNLDSVAQLCKFDLFKPRPPHEGPRNFSYDQFRRQINDLEDDNKLKRCVNYFFKPRFTDMKPVFDVPSVKKWSSRHRKALEAEKWFTSDNKNTPTRQLQNANMRLAVYGHLNTIMDDQMDPGTLKDGMIKEISMWRQHEFVTVRVIEDMAAVNMNPDPYERKV